MAASGMINDLAANSLDLVKSEIAGTFDVARSELEDFVDEHSSVEALERVADLLHLAQGALKVIELHGAGMLAEEMEAGCRYVAQLDDPHGALDALETLTAAMVQLPVYLDRVVRGGRDVPLVLLPLLNDLRVIRQAAPLSEGSLFLLNAGPYERHMAANVQAIPVDDTSSRKFRNTARRLRPSFQQALLRWIKNEYKNESLARLVQVSTALERAAVTEPVQQLWCVLTAVLASIAAGGLEATVTIKRLAGQADRQLKRLIDAGEAAFVHEPPVELLNNLLFYVARANSESDRLRELRERYRLAEFTPGDDQIEMIREDLAGPSVRLMRTVAEAIKEDLGTVKDALDLFARSGLESVEHLESQLEMLKKIGDTLGVLGLEDARSRIETEADTLKAVVARRELADPGVLERMAAVVLEIEDALDHELMRSVASDGDTSFVSESDAQYRHVAQAVIAECVVNLSKIKEAVSHLADGHFDGSALDQIKPQLRGITAGLLMLNKAAAVKIVERVGQVILHRLGQSDVAMKADDLERLADAIVSVEYYMETVGRGRSEPEYMLDNASRCLDYLEALPEGTDVPTADTPHDPAEVAQQSAADTPAAPPATNDTDPDLVNVFIEEAREELATIQQHLPAWIERHQDAEALISVRRSFHTLKGSGRMVGAERIGEFAWSVENLLNRIINQTLVPSGSIVELLRDAAAVLPDLIAQFEAGERPGTDISGIVQRAQALADGRPSAPEVNEATDGASDGPAASAGTSEATAGAPNALDEDALQRDDFDLNLAVSDGLLAVEESSSAVDSMPTTQDDATGRPLDPVLASIFVDELLTHVSAIHRFVERRAQGGVPHRVDAELYRAGHTLLGSANTAGHEPAIRLVRPISRLLARRFDAGESLDAQGISSLREAADELVRMGQALKAGIGYTVPDALVARLENLAAEADVADTRAARTSAARTSAEPGSDGAALEPVSTPAPETTTGPSELPAPTEFQGVPDPEIAVIFAEEATEILENAELALQAMRQDQASSGGLVEMQRLLHTLKGGARMANVIPMGDLSHAFEALLAAMASGRVKVSESAFDLMRLALDRLHDMRDAIDTGRYVANDVSDLVGSLEAAASGMAKAAPTAPPAIEATTPSSVVDAPALADEASASQERSSEHSEEPVGGIQEFQKIPEIHEAHSLGEVLPHPEVDQQPSAERVDAAHEEPEAARAHGVEAAPGGQRWAERVELARVDAVLLDDLLNSAGEVSIFQSRLKQQVHSFDFHLGELGQTVTRLQDQLRKLEVETEAQILHGRQDAESSSQDFDPLELDRYSTIQQLSRALAESASDVASINDSLQGLATEADSLLIQQGRVTSELQDGLMKTRMVPFQRHVPRLERIVRQAANDTGKLAELVVAGAASELDRHVLDSIIAPLEHLLRNAVVHGIESPEQRRTAHKSETGRVGLKLRREGAEVIVEVKDDGAGLKLDVIRRKAFEQGLIGDPGKVSDEVAADLILRPGFSTAGELTQAAGRGVGMDVVDNEVKKLGGSMRIESVPEQGVRFLIRLPITLAITHALIVDVGDETFALPLPTVEGVARVPRDQILSLLTLDDPRLDYGGVSYRIQHLGSLVGSSPSALPEEEAAVSLVLVRAGDSSTALLTDSLEGSREIVVKSLGPHVATVSGVSGATILGDGRVVMILDAATLARSLRMQARPIRRVEPPVVRPVTALVVDDSITMRRVTQRMLERRGLKVLTARDGRDAIDVLQDAEADIILLDIEMPRMDGYQFATHVRNDTKLKDVPIIMITSRSGEKHRAKAIEIGVNDYLSKPYQEDQLAAAVGALLGKTL